MKSRLLLLSLSALFASSCYAGCNEIQLHNSVDATALWADLSYLADDKLEGRKHGTVGNQLAREYISDRYQAMQLKCVYR